jgi:hypothetical protein
LREAVKKEGENALELALRMTALTTRMQAALPGLLRGESHQTIEDLIFRRYEVANSLKLHAEELDRLMKLPSWPKGGDWDLAKAHFGPPKRWLVDQCLKVFFHANHSDMCGIRPLASKDGSPFGDYVGAIYELGTGEVPWAEGVGLGKIIDNTARQWRKNTKLSNRISPQPTPK